jgi:hypothetical protein
MLKYILNITFKLNKMITTGALPLRGTIEFSFNEDALRLIASKLSSYLDINAILASPDKKGESKKRLSIKITSVTPAGEYRSETTHGKPDVNFLDLKKALGIARAETYFIDHVFFPNAWLLFGELQNSKKTPICIVYVPKFEIGAYSLKKDDENLVEFNPSLN